MFTIKVGDKWIKAYFTEYDNDSLTPLTVTCDYTNDQTEALAFDQPEPPCDIRDAINITRRVTINGTRPEFRRAFKDHIPKAVVYQNNLQFH